MADLIGGAIKKSVKNVDNSFGIIYMFFAFLLLLFIRVYLVKLAYNTIVPKIMKDNNVYKLTYLDALFVVILLMR